MSGANTEGETDSEEEFTIMDRLEAWASSMGLRGDCPECGHDDLDEAQMVALAAGEAHHLAGIQCPACGFAAATSTVGKATARGRSVVHWPSGTAADEQEDAEDEEEPEETEGEEDADE